MDQLLTIEELSKYLGIPIGTLYNWSHQGRLPKIKLGKHVRFRRWTIDRWLEAQEKRPSRRWPSGTSSHISNAR